MDSAHGHAHCGIRGEQHVDNLGASGWVEHRRKRIDVHHFPLDKPESRGCVHPGVRSDNERSGEGAADRHHDACECVGPRTELLPAIQVQAQEDGFEEKREPLQGERHSDDVARRFHKGGPEQAELERQHRPRHCPDREEYRRSPGPPLGEVQVLRSACADPGDFRRNHHDGHRHADDGKDDVERQR